MQPVYLRKREGSILSTLPKYRSLGVRECRRGPGGAAGWAAARAGRRRGQAPERTHRSYLATTRRIARPQGSQIAARKTAVAAPCVTSSGKLAAQAASAAGQVSGWT